MRAGGPGGAKSGDRFARAHATPRVPVADCKAAPVLHLPAGDDLLRIVVLERQRVVGVGTLVGDRWDVGKESRARRIGRLALLRRGGHVSQIAYSSHYVLV